MLSSLTNWQRQEYINNTLCSSRATVLLHVSLPLHHQHSGANKRNKHPAAASRPSPLSCRPYSTPDFPLAFPKAALSQNYRSSLHSQCFPERPNTRPKPKHILEARATLQRRTHAGILSANQKTNLCPNPQRISEATNKCALRS